MIAEILAVLLFVRCLINVESMILNLTGLNINWKVRLLIRQLKRIFKLVIHCWIFQLVYTSLKEYFTSKRKERETKYFYSVKDLTVLQTEFVNQIQTKNSLLKLQ